jgi:hypothetical protein
MARLAVAQRVRWTDEDDEIATELALKYRLVSSYTSLILVMEPAGQKAEGLPILLTVPQMLAIECGGLRDWDDQDNISEKYLLFCRSDDNYENCLYNLERRKQKKKRGVA